MNYRHAYHAGNFADVFKHAALAAILLRMQARPKPLCFLESHAGAGLYSLEGSQARRGGEAKDGILRLAELAPQHAALAAYLRIVKALEPNRDGLRVYPGSPLIAAGLLGAEDRLVLTEKLPEEADVLRQLFRQDARAAVHCRDGWEAIGALLPPTPRRGLLLVDPPGEAPVSGGGAGRVVPDQGSPQPEALLPRPFRARAGRRAARGAAGAPGRQSGR